MGPGAIIPLVMNRGLSVPLSMLAIMKVGAVFAPIDESASPTYIRNVITSLNSHLCLVDDANDLSGITMFVVKEHFDKRPVCMITPSPRDIDDPIYILHTSGMELNGHPFEIK